MDNFRRIGYGNVERVKLRNCDRDGYKIMRRLLLLILFAVPCFGQSWSGVLATSRAIAWTSAGLPATLPSGETTTDPWTPPTRTQCVTTACNTVSGGTVTFASINAALAAAPSGTYVLIPSGTYTLNGTGGCSSSNSANITLWLQSGVTLRGSGAQSTIINLGTDGSTASICYGITYNNGSGSITAGLTQGSTSITVSSVSGAGGLTIGQLAYLTQCNTGLSGATCTTGAVADNGGLFVCAYNTACSQQTSGSNVHAQQQVVRITGCDTSTTVGHVCTIAADAVTFSPGLYLANWSTGQTPTLNWSSSSGGGGIVEPNSNGLEDMTLNIAGNGNNDAISFDRTYASWMKGVRILGIGGAYALNMLSDKNCLFFNNYIFAALPLDNVDNTMLGMGNSSDNLILNNILTGGVAWEGEGANEGNVIAYNFSRFGNTTYYQDSMFEHHEGSAFFLFEGNEQPKFNEDDTWGTGFLNTWFRNYDSGADPPYVIAGSNTAFSLGIGAFRRFDNAIGNAVGSAQTTTYQSTIASPTSDPEFEFNNGSPQDSLTETGYMRWGNCDVVNAACRFNSGEVPTTLSGAATTYENTVPGSNNLPCSFFLAGYTSTTCTPHSNGGTGLNFWKVCLTWTTFPTTCATTQTNPFPAIGPDVTSGPYVNGTAYDVPAGLAYANLPIDTSGRTPTVSRVQVGQVGRKP